MNIFIEIDPLSGCLSAWSWILVRGIWMSLHQVNFNAIPIYRNREQRTFWFGDRLNPPQPSTMTIEFTWGSLKSWIFPFGSPLNPLKVYEIKELFRTASNSTPSQQCFYFSIFSNRWRWVWNSWAIGKIWSLCGSLQWEWISGHLGERSHPCQVLQTFFILILCDLNSLLAQVWQQRCCPWCNQCSLPWHGAPHQDSAQAPCMCHLCLWPRRAGGCKYVSVSQFSFCYTTGCLGHRRNQSPWWEIWSKYWNLLTIRGQLVHWISTSKAKKQH